MSPILMLLVARRIAAARRADSRYPQALNTKHLSSQTRPILPRGVDATDARRGVGDDRRGARRAAARGSSRRSTSSRSTIGRRSRTSGTSRSSSGRTTRWRARGRPRWRTADRCRRSSCWRICRRRARRSKRSPGGARRTMCWRTSSRGSASGNDMRTASTLRPRDRSLATRDLAVNVDSERHSTSS